MVTDLASAVTVWGPEEGSRLCYAVEEDPNVGTRWVGILSAEVAAGHRFLLIHLLYEPGPATLIWGMEGDRPAGASRDAFYSTGEIVPLDVLGNEVLYAEIPAAGRSVLHLYHCLTQEDQVLEEIAGSYSAGCLLPSGQAAICRRQIDGKAGAPPALLSWR